MEKLAVVENEARKRAENAWKLTRLALDKATDRIFWIKRSGRLFYVNNSTCESLGYSRERFLSMYIGDIAPDF